MSSKDVLNSCIIGDDLDLLLQGLREKIVSDHITICFYFCFLNSGLSDLN
jgi:hypothetical protein